MNGMVQCYAAPHPIESITIIKKYVSDIYLLINSPAAARISNIYVYLYHIILFLALPQLAFFSVQRDGGPFHSCVFVCRCFQMGGNDKDHSSRVIRVRVVAFKFSAGKNGLKHSDLLLLKICGQHVH